MDTVTALNGKSDAGADMIRDIMRGYAMLLGLREAEASALATAIASGPDRPAGEREALARVERAVLDPNDVDGSDRALLATWLASEDADRDPARLPMGAPAATGLQMPAQLIECIRIQDVAELFGAPARPRGRAVRGDVR